MNLIKKLEEKIKNMENKINKLEKSIDKMNRNFVYVEEELENEVEQIKKYNEVYAEGYFNPDSRNSY